MNYRAATATAAALRSQQPLRLPIHPSIRPLTSPYETLLQALSNDPHSTPSIHCTKQLHAFVITNGFSSKSVLVSRLIASYASLSVPEDAYQLFATLPHKTLHTYNHLLNTVHRHPSLISKIYSQMLCDDQVSPDPITYSILLKACSNWVGRKVHAHVLVTSCAFDLRLATDILCLYSKDGDLNYVMKQFESMPERDTFVWTVAIDGHLRCGEYGTALSLFSRMRESGLKAGVATWNALIAGFAREGLVKDVLCQIRLMQMSGVRPDNVTLCSMLPLFAGFAVLKPGREVHAYTVRNGFELELFVVSALVDMYAKCGRLELARGLFDRVEAKDTGVWNAIIAGYGMHGQCEGALVLFYKMIESGGKPNEITFTSVLSACSHGGFVSEGRRIFNKMVFNYEIIARREHYACIVDMYGRAGLLEEAFAVIRNMPFEATEDIRRAFLSAYRIHCSRWSIKFEAKDAFETNETGEDAGYHVMLSNIFAGSGRWSDVAKMRTRVKDSGVKRTGWSWIEAGDDICTFSTGDMLHPRSNEIYSLLKNINSIISLRFEYPHLAVNLV